MSPESERSDRECSLICYYTVTRTIDSVLLPSVIVYFALFPVLFLKFLSSIYYSRFNYISELLDNSCHTICLIRDPFEENTNIAEFYFRKYFKQVL